MSESDGEADDPDTDDGDDRLQPAKEGIAAGPSAPPETAPPSPSVVAMAGATETGASAVSSQSAVADPTRAMVPFRNPDARCYLNATLRLMSAMHKALGAREYAACVNHTTIISFTTYYDYVS